MPGGGVRSEESVWKRRAKGGRLREGGEGAGSSGRALGAWRVRSSTGKAGWSCQLRGAAWGTRAGTVGGASANGGPGLTAAPPRAGRVCHSDAKDAERSPRDGRSAAMVSGGRAAGRAGRRAGPSCVVSLSRSPSPSAPTTRRRRRGEPGPARRRFLPSSSAGAMRARTGGG